MGSECAYILRVVVDELDRIRTVCEDEGPECWKYFIMKLEKEIETEIRSILRTAV